MRSPGLAPVTYNPGLSVSDQSMSPLHAASDPSMFATTRPSPPTMPLPSPLVAGYEASPQYRLLQEQQQQYQQQQHQPRSHDHLQASMEPGEQNGEQQGGEEHGGEQHEGEGEGQGEEEHHGGGGNFLSEMLDSKLVLYVLLGVGIYFLLKGMGNYCQEHSDNTMCQVANAFGQAAQALGNAVTKALDFLTSTAGEIVMGIIGGLAVLGFLVGLYLKFKAAKNASQEAIKKITGKDAETAQEAKDNLVTTLRERGLDEYAEQLEDIKLKSDCGRLPGVWEGIAGKIESDMLQGKILNAAMVQSFTGVTFGTAEFYEAYNKALENIGANIRDISRGFSILDGEILPQLKKIEKLQRGDREGFTAARDSINKATRSALLAMQSRVEDLENKIKDIAAIFRANPDGAQTEKLQELLKLLNQLKDLKERVRIKLDNINRLLKLPSNATPQDGEAATAAARADVENPSAPGYVPDSANAAAARGDAAQAEGIGNERNAAADRENVREQAQEAAARETTARSVIRFVRKSFFTAETDEFSYTILVDQTTGRWGVEKVDGLNGRIALPDHLVFAEIATRQLLENIDYYTLLTGQDLEYIEIRPGYYLFVLRQVTGPPTPARQKLLDLIDKYRAPAYNETSPQDIADQLSRDMKEWNDQTRAAADEPLDVD